MNSSDLTHLQKHISMCVCTPIDTCNILRSRLSSQLASFKVFYSVACFSLPPENPQGSHKHPADLASLCLQDSTVFCSNKSLLMRRVFFLSSAGWRHMKQHKQRMCRCSLPPSCLFHRLESSLSMQPTCKH